MAKPTVEWIEDDVLSLPLGENDAFERKGAALLDLTLAQAREDSVRDELAKQLSAFANTGGGQIIYGLTNAGAVDLSLIHIWCRRCSSALRFAPASSRSPVRNAQNIRLTDNAKGP